MASTKIASRKVKGSIRSMVRLLARRAQKWKPVLRSATRHSLCRQLDVGMHDGAVLGEHGGLHQLVVPVDGERLGLFVEHRFKEGEEVACEQLARRGREPRRHV